jgi:hypothetical protein
MVGGMRLQSLPCSHSAQRWPKILMPRQRGGLLLVSAHHRNVVGGSATDNDLRRGSTRLVAAAGTVHDSRNFTERVRTPDTVPRPESSEPLSLDPPRDRAVH